MVDEINQGMDERNERLVFDRIVRNCSSSSTQRLSQYFLVSPKLLPGLTALENENVSVLLVFNGPGIKIDARNFSLRLLKEQSQIQTHQNNSHDIKRKYDLITLRDDKTDVQAKKAVKKGRIAQKENIIRNIIELD
jgi:hypothetical protein